MAKLNEIMIDSGNKKYQSLKDDIFEIKRKGIETVYIIYWEVGKRIRKDLPVCDPQTEQPELKPLLKKLIKDTKIDKITLYQSVKFFDKYPSGIALKELPDHTSWTKIRTELLPEKKKQPVKEIKAVKEVIAENKTELKTALTDKCDDCKIVRKMADKISELEDIIKQLRTSPKKPAIMGFNHKRIRERYLELYAIKKGRPSGFIQWAAFMTALSKLANTIPEQTIYDGWESFFADKWANENNVFDPLVYLNHIDKYIGKTENNIRKADIEKLKKIRGDLT